MSRGLAAVAMALAGIAAPLHTQERPEALPRAAVAATPASPAAFPAEFGPPVRLRHGGLDYVVPRNFFRGHIAPSPSENGWYLWVLWPDFTPWRQHQAADDAAFNELGGGRVMGILVDFLDREMPDLMNRIVANQDRPDRMWHKPGISRPGAWSNRLTGEPVHGLTPYYIDLRKVAAFLRAVGQHSEADSTSVDTWLSRQDWFLGRNDKGQVTTLIQCDSHEVSEEQAAAAKRFPRCNHLVFLDASHRAFAKVLYRRVYLRDWREIEAKARSLHARFRSAAEQR